MQIANDKFPKERNGLITGSKCSILFPDKGDGKAGQLTYAKQLAIQLYFNYFESGGNWQTEHGDMNEHSAFEFYKSNYDFSCEKGSFVQNGDYGGSSDALCDSHGVDFKCPTTLEKWVDYLFVGIDKQQYHQCQMYMWLFNKPMWKVAIYLTETKWMDDTEQQYPVPQNQRMIIVEVAKKEGWENELIEKGQFVIEQRDLLTDKLKENFSALNTQIDML